MTDDSASRAAGSAASPALELEKVRQYLTRLAGLVTKPTKYGFQMLRRDREDGSIEYQIFADTKGNGRQIAWVQSSRHDAEFITACLAQAPLFDMLLRAALGGRTAPEGRFAVDQETGIRYRVIAERIDGFDLAFEEKTECVRWVSQALFRRIFKVEALGCPAQEKP